MPRLCDDDIPASLAASLHALGLSWAAVGRLIARQRGRKAPYQSGSVQGAVLRAKNRSKKVLTNA
jgi:hypothetical protein